MVKEINKVLLTGLIALFALSSCATIYYWKGKSREEDKRYEKAISYYKRALQKNPKSEKYRQALERVKHNYARVLTEKAKETIRSNPINLATLDSALKTIEKAVSLKSTYKEAEKYQTELEATREKLNSELKRVIKNKDENLSRKDWNAALASINRAIEIEPRSESLKNEKERILDEAFYYYWGKSQTYYQTKHYKQALGSIDLALKYRQPNKALAFRDRIRKAIEAEKLYKEAKSKIINKNYSEAVPLLEKVIYLNPEKEEAKTDLAEIYYIEGSRNEKMGFLLNALQDFRTALKYKEPYKDVYRRMRKIESKIGEICLSHAKEYLIADLPGNALLTVKACSRWIEKSDFATLEKSAIEQMRRSFLWPFIAIVDFSRSARSKRGFTASLEAEILLPDQIAQLAKESYPAYIKSRNITADLLDELNIKISSIRSWDDRKLERLASVLDSRFIVVGQITEFDIRHSKTSEARVKKYQIGTRTVPNPEYYECNNRCDSCKSRCESCTGDYCNIVCGTCAITCAACLAISPTIEEPIYQDCHYIVNHHYIEGFLQVRYIIYDRDTGQFIINELLETSYNRRDSETAGCPAADVPEDPLELPTEEEVAEDLIKLNAESFYQKLRNQVLERLNEIYLTDARRQGESIYEGEYLAMASLICPHCSSIQKQVDEYCKTVEKSFTETEFKLAATSHQLSSKVRTGRKWALVVGINKYADVRIPTLRFAQKDAVLIRSALIKYCHFPPQNIKMLLGSRAKRAEILAAINWLAKVTKSSDTAIIFFAGHGGLEPDRSQPDGYGKYLLPYDANIRQSLYATAISYTEIASVFSKIRAKKLIFFIDACYSGAAGGRDFLEGRTRDISIQPTHLERLSRIRGRIIIASSDGNQPSIEIPEKQHGVFTYYLVKGLSGKADGAPKDGKVTLFELYTYVHKKVQEEAAKRKLYQEPILKGELAGAQLVLSTLK